MEKRGFDIHKEKFPKKSVFYKNLNHLRQVEKFNVTCPRIFKEKDKKKPHLSFELLYKLSSGKSEVPEEFKKAKAFMYNKYTAFPYMFIDS